MFRSTYSTIPIRPSSGGAHAVLCVITELDPADVRSLNIFCSIWLYVIAVCLYVCLELLYG